MKVKDKTREQLTEELEELRRRVAELEATQAKHLAVERVLQETEEEKQIMERVYRGAGEDVTGVVEVSELESVRETMGAIHMEEKIVDYIVRLTRATRNSEKYGLGLNPMISYGASPRAAIWLGLAARAHAFLMGRGYVTPQDVKSLAPDVLRHRIILSYEAEAEGKSSDDLITTLLERIEVP